MFCQYNLWLDCARGVCQIAPGLPHSYMLSHMRYEDLCDPDPQKPTFIRPRCFVHQYSVFRASVARLRIPQHPRSGLRRLMTQWRQSSAAITLL
jgi:hypothetical protein